MRNVSGHTSQEAHTHVLTHKVEGALNVQCTHAGVRIFVSKIFQAMGLLSLLTMFSVCERQIERDGGLDEKTGAAGYKETASNRDGKLQVWIARDSLSYSASFLLSSCQLWKVNKTITATSVHSHLSWL